MDLSKAKARASKGWEALRPESKNAKQMKRREDYLHGEQDDPWTPDGIGAEHESLRAQAKANWMPLPVFAPIQRMRCEGVRTGLGGKADKALWRDVWAANRLEARQTIIYESMMTHGRGIVGVWANAQNKARPTVRPQSVREVYLHPSEEDPFTLDYAVKIVQREKAPNALIVPGGTREAAVVAFVYDADSWMKLEREDDSWTQLDHGTHGMKQVPFVTFDYRANASGEVFSPIDPLIPQQNAINTIRFNMLLAMQFSAYRQRVVTGFDPVMRDQNGNIVWKKNTDGTDVIVNGAKVPLLSDFGRVAVDRMLVFNGDQTKVFDMPESNLANYVTMLTEFLTQFFATSQVPPQYLLSRMANLSGDAISGAESTLTSLQGELKRYANEGMVETFTLASRAAGMKDEPDPDMEMLYADTEVKSFGVVVDGIQKLITTGFPREAAWEMIPGANAPKVDRWMKLADEELKQEMNLLVKGDINDAPNGSETALQLATAASSADAEIS